LGVQDAARRKYRITVTNTKPFPPSCSPFHQEPVAAMPLIYLTEVELASRVSLCLLVNLADLSQAALQHLESLLSSSERKQYANITSNAERRLRQAARAALRMVLGRLAGVFPAQVRLGLGKYGKPYMLSSRDVGFSVSHSGSFSLLAFAEGAEIGCDIERNAPLDDLRDLSDVVLHPEEAETIFKLNGCVAQAVLLRNWVRKEAVLKAIGVGFSVDPTQIKVGLNVSEIQLRRADDDTAVSTFNLYCRTPVEGYLAAAASPYPACKWRTLSI
jgi:4'-phosphopantetheinyl transferase